MPTSGWLPSGEGGDMSSSGCGDSLRLALFSTSLRAPATSSGSGNLGVLSGPSLGTAAFSASFIAFCLSALVRALCLVRPSWKVIV